MRLGSEYRATTRLGLVRPSLNKSQERLQKRAIAFFHSVTQRDRALYGAGCKVMNVLPAEREPQPIPGKREQWIARDSMFKCLSRRAKAAPPIMAFAQ